MARTGLALRASVSCPIPASIRSSQGHREDEGVELVKRFTETTKWDDPWFRRLSARLKCLWQFFCDRCDAAGVIDPDWELASFQIGESVSENDMAAFEGRVEKLKCGKWWIQRFIPFQYGNLSPDCKAHGPAFSSLDAHGLKERVSKGYPKGLQTPKVQEKVKDKDKQGVQGEAFAEFWKLYPRKDAKADAVKAWAKVPFDLYDVVLDALERQIGQPDWTKDGGKFIPYPASWLNGKRWEDVGFELPLGTPGTEGNGFL